MARNEPLRKAGSPATAARTTSARGEGDPCEVPTSFNRRKPHSAPHPHGACRSGRLLFDRVASAFAPALRAAGDDRRHSRIELICAT